VQADAVVEWQNSGQKGAGALAILSSGFGETEDGKQRNARWWRWTPSRAVRPKTAHGLLNFCTGALHVWPLDTASPAPQQIRHLRCQVFRRETHRSCDEQFRSPWVYEWMSPS